MSNRGVHAISGVSGSGAAFLIANAIKKDKGKNLIIVPTEPVARRLAEDISFFTGEPVKVLPDEEQLFLHFEARNNDMAIERINAMKALTENDDCIVIAPVAAAVKKAAPHSMFIEGKLAIRRGEEHFLSDVREKLVKLGYEQIGMVESPGEFSVRGGILDVFTPDAQRPYRIEFFDTEVDSIRSFDPETQRSMENLKFVEINPAQEMILDKELFAEAADKLHRAYTKQANLTDRKSVV